MTEQEYISNRGLIYFWANRYRARLKECAVADIDDLIQAGALGLMEAQKTYQPVKGAWFTWASFYIRKAMREALGLCKQSLEAHAVSLDAPAYTKNGEPSEDALIESIADTSNPDMDDMLLENEIIQTVRDAVDSLPEDQRNVTRLHDLEGNTYAKCDQLLELNGGDSRRISSRAFRQLRKDRRLRALIVEQETAYHRHKGPTAFNSSMSSVVEDLVIWRIARERNLGL